MKGADVPALKDNTEVKRVFLAVWIYRTFCLLKAQKKSKKQSTSTTRSYFPANPQFKCSLFLKCFFCRSNRKFDPIGDNSGIHPEGTQVIHQSIFSYLCIFITVQICQKILHFSPSFGEVFKTEKKNCDMYISQCTSETASRISAEKKYFIALMMEIPSDTDTFIESPEPP